MIDQYGVPRLTDFGYSRMIHPDNMAEWFSSRSMVCGTTAWMAPEIFEATGDAVLELNEATDVYALGITAYVSILTV